MKVINIHKRLIQAPVSKITELFETLATENDMMLATDKWPPMRLDKGLQIGSKGGHGAIKYFVSNYQPEKSITFQFDLKGFDGFHRFEIAETEPNKTQLTHTIDLRTSGLATLKWILAIRWLHDAYIEDAFDKVENHFALEKKQSKWNFWVKILRNIMTGKEIFLLDGLGAILSILGLLLLSNYEETFGMSKKYIFPLVIISSFYSIFSLFCYFFKPLHWRKYLKIIAILNLIYCGLTVFAISQNFHNLSIIGYLYFVVELLIMLSLVVYEFKLSKNKQK